MNIKFLKQTSLIFCQNSYRRFRTRSVPLSEGNIVFFQVMFKSFAILTIVVMLMAKPILGTVNNGVIRELDEPFLAA